MRKKVNSLKQTAEEIRLRLVEVVYKAGAGHIGGGLSSVDLLTALYFRILNVDPEDPGMDNRDRFIMSKGHSVEALYCTLEAAGFIAPGKLDSYGEFNSPFAGHPTSKIPGIEVNSGALGHGLSVGVGMALAARMDKKSYRTYVLMGDGEQGEGSIYEAAMSASHYKLDNLIAIIDRNGLQISDTTENVMSLEPMDRRWEAFGWDVHEMDGNDPDAILRTFENIDYTNGKPHLIISRTTKGKGISFMENGLKWHHGVPCESEYQQAVAEIKERLASYQLLTD